MDNAGRVYLDRRMGKCNDRLEIGSKHRSSNFLLTALLVLGSAVLSAGPGYAATGNQTGHITRVSYVTTGILIMIDNPLPTNCTGTPFGWMQIGSSSNAMLAFVTGLWMRGDSSQITLTIYTSGIDATGFCQVSQIDTNGVGSG